jgi:hypothetical protein
MITNHIAADSLALAATEALVTMDVGVCADDGDLV